MLIAIANIVFVFAVLQFLGIRRFRIASDLEK